MSLAKPAIPADELGWVITRYLNSKLLYWDGGGTDQYSFARDNGRAIRFARKVDADVVLGRMLEGNGRVEEHMWVNTIPASSPSSKQEDDREWRSRCHLLIGHHNAARSVWFGKYGLVGEAGKPKNLRWGIGAATNWESDTAAYDALAKAPPPPDSKPPTQSEVEEPDGRCSCKGPGHSPLCLGGFAPSPTKPTQSVQPLEATPESGQNEVEKSTDTCKCGMPRFRHDKYGYQGPDFRCSGFQRLPNYKPPTQPQTKEEEIGEGWLPDGIMSSEYQAATYHGLARDEMARRLQTFENKWRSYVRQLHAEKQRVEEAIRWACGERGDFAPPPHPSRTGAYWWRKELRERAGLTPPTPGATT